MTEQHRLQNAMLIESMNLLSLASKRSRLHTRTYSPNHAPTQSARHSLASYLLTTCTSASISSSISDDADANVPALVACDTDSGKVSESNSSAAISLPMDGDNVPLLSNKGSNLISVISWNIAAINNNPFEYWMDPSGCADTHVAQAEAAYSRLMTKADKFIGDQRQAGADQTVKVKDIMTPAMVEELFQLMAPKGWVGLEETRRYYDEGVCCALHSLVAALVQFHPTPWV